jgi:hypothetical protein
VDKQREEIEMLGRVFSSNSNNLSVSREFISSPAASSDIDLKSTLEQMDKQKKLIAKFETERGQYKTRIKELTDEMSMMQGREFQGSDEDSPDQLSEIDRQQDLMANISMKNKHIKRLLRDIEVNKKLLENLTSLNCLRLDSSRNSKPSRPRRFILFKNSR